MTTTHTPGPWAVGIDDPEKVFQDGSGVATMSGGRRSEQERRANARLIASAPELLEALNDLLIDVFAAEENEYGERVCAVCQRPDYLDCNPDDSCGRARAAIAKAERKLDENN